MVNLSILAILTCAYLAVTLTHGQDGDGFFLLSGAAEKTVYKLENGNFSTIPVSNQIEVIAFDPLTRRVYFGSTYSIHLYSMALDGTDVRVEATTDLYIQAIAVDSAAGNIFVYSPGNTGKIYRVVTGRDPTLDQSDVIHQDDSEVFYMTVDPSTRTLFWGSTTGVWQSNYDGTNKKQLLSTSDYIKGLAVDGRHVYGIKNGKIFRIERSYQTYNEIFDTGDSSSAKSLVLVGNSLYFSSSVCVYNPTTRCNSSIAAVRTDGTGYKRVGPALTSGQGYRLNLVYVNRTNVVTAPVNASVTAAPVTASPSVTARVPNATVPVQSPDGNGFFLLAGAAEKTVYKHENGNFSTIPVTNQIEVIAFDPLTRRVYFGSTYSIHLYSMALDGTDVRMEATTDLYIQAIAIDSVEGSIFVYSPGNTGKIYRVVMGKDSTLDQSNIIHQNEREVFYMAVDRSTRTLFWGSTTGVWQSNYDGTNKKQLLSTSDYIKGLAVDEKTVYGIKNGKIFRFNRLYQTYDEIFDTGDSSSAKSLVLVGNSLYFSSSVCVYNPTTRCNTSIATLATDGRNFKRLRPTLSTVRGYHHALVYVSSGGVPAEGISTTADPCDGQDIEESDIHTVKGDTFLLSGAAKGGIYKLNENKTYSAIPVTDTVTAQAFDYASNRLYYGVGFQLFVYSMRLDGSDVRKEATTDLYVQALAVDSMAQSMFVYSTNKGRIYRVRLGQDWTMDQSNVIHSDQREVFHMTADPHTRKLIWGSYDGVFQSNYDGTDKKLVFAHTGYIDGVTFDDWSIYVLCDNTIWTVDRLSAVFYQVFQKYNSRLTDLVATGGHLYFVKYHCTNSPSYACKIGIGRIDDGGAWYANVGTLLYTSFVQTPKLVHINGALQHKIRKLKRCKTGTVDADLVGDPDKINVRLLVALIVSPLAIVAVAVTIFFLWWKVFSVRRSTKAQGYTTGFESPHYAGGTFGANNQPTGQLANNVVYTVSNVPSEKEALEKQYREIHVYDQIK